MLWLEDPIDAFRVLDLTDSAAMPSADLMDVTVPWTELGFLDQESADESQEFNTSNDVNNYMQ